MSRTIAKFLCILILLAARFPLQICAQEMPAEYKNVLRELGRSGDFKDQVLKVNIPRNDLAIKIRGVLMPTPLGFAGWVAMTKGDGGLDVLMGDLVLLEDEVNPVLSALLDNGLEATALHNHFFWEQPRIFYMHVHGRGAALDLARRLKPALSRIGDAAPPPNVAPGTDAAPAQSSPPALDAKNLAGIIGHPGAWNGPVYKITIGRSDFQVKEHGAVINARMGLNTWAAFAGSNEQAMVAGDVAMLESEVPAVLKALRQNDLAVVAIHHHMIGARPVIIFLHYWGTGRAEKLAAGVKDALAQIGRASKSAATPRS